MTGSNGEKRPHYHPMQLWTGQEVVRSGIVGDVDCPLRLTELMTAEIERHQKEGHLLMGVVLTASEPVVVHDSIHVVWTAKVSFVLPCPGCDEEEHTDSRPGQSGLPPWLVRMMDEEDND